MAQMKLPSPQERLDLILLALARRQPVKSLCKQAGVSRELFYRWMRLGRRMLLQALEARAPGPKPYREATAAEVKTLKQRLDQTQKELAKMRKERDYLKLVEKTARRIIRRNAWGRLPQVEVKKNSMRARKTGSSTNVSGLSRASMGHLSEYSPGYGESIETPTGSGSAEGLRSSGRQA